MPGSPFFSIPGPAAPAYLGAMGANLGLAAGNFITWATGGEVVGGPPGALIGGILGAIAGVLEDLFGGGGPSYPWWYIREATRVGGSPSTWAPIEGLPPDYPPNQGKSTTLRGIASYYYPTGRLTASGYSYTNPNALIAAMPPNVVGPQGMYPFGTRAQVTYQGRTVTVAVVDHGPYVAGRVIDLSPGAFRALAPLGLGTIPVTVVIPAPPKAPLE